MINISDRSLRFSKFKTCYHMRLRGREFCHACEGGYPSLLAQGLLDFCLRKNDRFCLKNSLTARIIYAQIRIIVKGKIL
jgi:hypothetical protein